MMRGAIAAAAGSACALALLALTLVGCPAVLFDDFHVGGAAMSDASAADAGVDATLLDSATDATPIDDVTDADASVEDAAPEAAAACCTAFADPLDETTFDQWAPEGVTRPFPTFVELTSEKLAQAGALFFPTAASIGDFELSFEFSITKTRDAGLPADGLAFVAMTSVAAPCDAGSQLCVIGTSRGFALLVRTYHSPSEPPAPYVAMIDTSHPIFTDAGPTILGGTVAEFDAGIVTYVTSMTDDPPDASWQTLCVRAVGGAATVKLNGKTVLSGIPVASLPSAHWGFVGATGGATERHAIRQMQIGGTPVCGDAAVCADAGICGD